MCARSPAGTSQVAGGEISDPRALLRREVAKLTEAECREVCEYIEIMRSLKLEGASRGLFGDGLARRVSAMCDGGRRATVSLTVETANANARDSRAVSSAEA